MTNHVHLVARPQQANSLARVPGQAHWIYARSLNQRYGRSGHLWQNRFDSCPPGAGHAVAALLSVDLNPLRAGLVGDAEQYPWSSASRHVGGSDAADLVARNMRSVRCLSLDLPGSPWISLDLRPCRPSLGFLAPPGGRDGTTIEAFVPRRGGWWCGSRHSRRNHGQAQGQRRRTHVRWRPRHAFALVSAR